MYTNFDVAATDFNDIDNKIQFMSILIMDPVRVDSFVHAIDLLIMKPHLINKRLWGCNLLFKTICQFEKCGWESALHDISLNNSQDVSCFINCVLNLTKLKIIDKNLVCSEQSNLVEVILVELLPKNYADSYCYQLVCLKKNAATATFYDVTPKHYNQNLCPNFTYSFQLLLEDIIVIGDNDYNSKSHQWLIKKVLPQITKWMDNELCTNLSKPMGVNGSLLLVSNDKYYRKYNDLKLKYGKEMVKIWPESTDPSKFVFEDVAIATYLLLLWEEESCEGSMKPATFLDVGCGNGLLVYILTMEGHEGLGVDIRKRKIWDMYHKDVKLQETIVTPDNIEQFSNFDWIIGNHSDELTPWIPVIASLSSYSCKFFLLPCCAYNFDGTKYQRQNSSKSQYNEYLDYINDLCKDCGFIVERDRLKIPSTKRICFIGRSRTYVKDQYEMYKNKTFEIVNNSQNCIGTKDKNFDVSNFKTRNLIEKVRNCTKLDKSLLEFIITTITNFLLEGCNFASEWTPGKEVCIVELISLIPQNSLKALKAECGGLQTLLKNNHHIFKVQKGKVQLKQPKSVKETLESIKKQKSKNLTIQVQVKPCWFFKNHPQGCPLSDRNCSFLHAR